MISTPGVFTLSLLPLLHPFSPLQPDIFTRLFQNVTKLYFHSCGAMFYSCGIIILSYCRRGSRFRIQARPCVLAWPFLRVRASRRAAPSPALRACSVAFLRTTTGQHENSLYPSINERKIIFPWHPVSIPHVA